MYGTDTFWPASPEMYRGSHLQPQLGLVEEDVRREEVEVDDQTEQDNPAARTPPGR